MGIFKEVWQRLRSFQSALQEKLAMVTAERDLSEHLRRDAGIEVDPFEAFEVSTRKAIERERR